MKNLILKSVLFLSLTVALVSCNKDDAPAPAAVEVAPSLIGKWVYSEQADDNGVFSPYQQQNADCPQDEIEFTTTKFFDRFYEKPSISDVCDLRVYSPDYSVANNVITMIDGNRTETATFIFLSAKQLKLTFEGGEITIYTRI